MHKLYNIYMSNLQSKAKEKTTSNRKRKCIEHIYNIYLYIIYYKQFFKRWDLVRVLIWGRLLQSWMFFRSQFKREGAAKEKALSPQV